VEFSKEDSIRINKKPKIFLNNKVKPRKLQSVLNKELEIIPEIRLISGKRQIFYDIVNLM